MGAICPFGGYSSEAARKQDARVDESLHKSRMELVDDIRQSIRNLGTNKTIARLLRSATPLQRARVRAHLEAKIREYYMMGAPIEAGIAERALRAFDAARYSNGHIARYLSQMIIKKIFV